MTDIRVERVLPSLPEEKTTWTEALQTINGLHDGIAAKVETAKQGVAEQALKINDAKTLAELGDLKLECKKRLREFATTEVKALKVGLVEFRKVVSTLKTKLEGGKKGSRKAKSGAEEELSLRVLFVAISPARRMVLSS